MNEPDQIDMMTEDELRSELRKAVHELCAVQHLLAKEQHAVINNKENYSRLLARNEIVIQERDTLQTQLTFAQMAVPLVVEKRIPYGYEIAPTEPTEVMVIRAGDFALKVQISSKYIWTDYMRDLWKIMLTASKEDKANGN